MTYRMPWADVREIIECEPLRRDDPAMLLDVLDDAAERLFALAVVQSWALAEVAAIKCRCSGYTGPCGCGDVCVQVAEYALDDAIEAASKGER